MIHRYFLMTAINLIIISWYVFHSCDSSSAVIMLCQLRNAWSAGDANWRRFCILEIFQRRESQNDRIWKIVRKNQVALSIVVQTLCLPDLPLRYVQTLVSPNSESYLEQLLQTRSVKSFKIIWCCAVSGNESSHARYTMNKCRDIR